MTGVRIRGADDHAADLGIDDSVSTGRCPAISGTGFQSDEEGRAFRLVTSLCAIMERFNFRMGSAGALVPAAANDLATSQQDRADHWIWRRSAASATGQAQGLAHVVSVTGHGGN